MAFFGLIKTNKDLLFLLLNHCSNKKNISF